jgi:hypothetical protein
MLGEKEGIKEEAKKGKMAEIKKSIITVIVMTTCRTCARECE